MQRLTKVLELINTYLKEFKPIITVTEHHVENNSEYLNIRIMMSILSTLIVVREYIVEGNIVAYGYYARIGGYEEWWNNRPHHPEIRTYPHHRHTKEGVKQLRTPNLETFLQYIRKRLLERTGKRNSHKSS